VTDGLGDRTLPSGPLRGLRVIELAGLGPAPFCAMLLADMGADVVTIDRAGGARDPDLPPFWNRGRRSVGLDLKSERGRDLLVQMVERADALIEGFRPGVTERLGIGPDVCLARNPRLVYGRVTGWGQDGPLAQAAGHDLNFIAVTGALAAIGRSGELPVPPLNLLGDFGGGGMLLAVGVCAAMLDAQRSGHGQVVDAAMVDGVAQLMTSIFALRAQGNWNLDRGTNLLDGGAPFYDVYRTSDGQLISVAALERRFFERLVERLGLSGDPVVQDRMNRSTWPALRERFTEIFGTRTRQEWCDLLEGSDCCFAPVLTLDEALSYPHNVARGTFVGGGPAETAQMAQPAPAPRFSATPSAIQRAAPRPGEHTDEVLAEWDIT
jgi:alpha-methylacyl-CoA racemase